MKTINLNHYTYDFENQELISEKPKYHKNYSYAAVNPDNMPVLKFNVPEDIII